jgi:predicted nucleic acid-binding protein
VEAVKEDPADNRILECAQAGRSDYIVTGDKDLLRLRVFRDIAIVKIADFLVMAEGRRR